MFMRCFWRLQDMSQGLNMTYVIIYLIIKHCYKPETVEDKVTRRLEETSKNQIFPPQPSSTPQKFFNPQQREMGVQKNIFLFLSWL